MLNTETVNPNLANFILSLRDIGYSFEVAVADLIDNSVSARASTIQIHSIVHPAPIFCMIDDGFGMSEEELVEAMRLSSKSPLGSRDKSDLGRFGLGLKTASFSQCKKLTVISKKGGVISARQWDLDFISEKNEWLLINPSNCSTLPYYDVISKQQSGTLVCWETLDRLGKNEHAYVIDKLRKHLALVFHRYLEGGQGIKALKILVNNNPVVPFNPFNSANDYTQELPVEKIWLQRSLIKVQPYILPHHSKLSLQEYNLYATEEGYLKSQGFYLYRRNRILIHGTWWGLHKALDAHKLVRIKIDIENDIDHLWGIDVKKSIARPCDEIRNDLKRIIDLATQRGSKPFVTRAKRIESKDVIQTWDLIASNNEIRFVLNRSHPLYKSLLESLTASAALETYLKSIEAYLPIDAIQYHLQVSPYSVKQEASLTEADIQELATRILSAGLPLNYMEELLKTDIFTNRRDLLI
ncbi:ATP-binding protein [Dyadobacter arcticus]|uniref:ATP-binding protein n=1 Tax=Dyadobacter arcticus TaxID=1078754 RepID=A0ABX0UH15_9BACT|nr:ATP-binding protein [Dyadobacter arcticus]NIJ52307.1 hypothetical protein [Dyadobacter arcticus]